MDILDFVTDKRKNELDKELEKEIYDLKNNIICKRKFIYIIKKYSFIEFCYLYSRYIKPLEENTKLPYIVPDETIFITEEDYYNYTPKRRITYKIQYVRKIKSIESMAVKGKKVKKRKK